MMNYQAKEPKISDYEPKIYAEDNPKKWFWETGYPGASTRSVGEFETKEEAIRDAQKHFFKEPKEYTQHIEITLYAYVIPNPNKYLPNIDLLVAEMNDWVLDNHFDDIDTGKWDETDPDRIKFPFMIPERLRLQAEKRLEKLLRRWVSWFVFIDKDALIPEEQEVGCIHCPPNKVFESDEKGED